MKFAWLEDMAKEGQVRPEALERIYEDCGATLEKCAFMENLGPGGQLAMQILLGSVATVGVGMSASVGAQAISEHMGDARTNAMTDANRTKIVTHPSIPVEDKAKAKARFNEILKYAPGLGANEAVMRQLVMTKYRTGLTNQDVQNLINIQVKMTPNALDYAAASSKHASAKVTVQEVCGEKLAEAYLRLEKVAFSFPNGFGTQLLKAISIPVAATASIGALGAVNSVASSMALKSRIERSKEEVFSAPKDSIIGSDRARAEQAFSTLVHFAPNIAAEPNTARSFVSRIVAYSKEKNEPLLLQGSDLKELTEIEKNMKSNKGFFENLNTALGSSGFGSVAGTSGMVAAGWK